MNTNFFQNFSYPVSQESVIYRNFSNMKTNLSLRLLVITECFCHVKSLSLKNMHFFFSSRDDLLSLLPLLSAELICSLACKKRKFNKKSLCVSAQPWKKKSCRPWIKCMDRPGSQMGLLLLFFGSQIQEFKESFRKRRRRIFTQFTFCFQLQIMATLTQSRGAGPKEGLFSRERLDYASNSLCWPIF